MLGTGMQVQETGASSLPTVKLSLKQFKIRK